MFAAIDATNLTGAVYGVGATPEAALADAVAQGADGTLETVPCTEAAAAYVRAHGGAPSGGLAFSSSGVTLATEVEDGWIDVVPGRVAVLLEDGVPVRVSLKETEENLYRGNVYADVAARWPGYCVRSDGWGDGEGHGEAVSAVVRVEE